MALHHYGYHQQYQPGSLASGPYYQSDFGPGPGHNSLFPSNTQNSPMATDSSGYLPGYLLGGHSSPSFKLQQQKQKYQPSLNTTYTLQPQPSPVTIGQALYTTTERKKETKPGGPPVESLHEHNIAPLPPGPTLPQAANSPERKQLMFTGLRTAQQATPNTPLNQTPGPPLSINNTLSPTQIDPFFSQCEQLNSESLLNDHWITVFGFPPNATSYILEQFSLYGNIISHELSGEGNWMHIQYQTKLQAKKALSKNGKVFSEGIMIGVQPCISKEAMDRHPTTPISTPISGSNRKPVSMRPLTAAYQASTSNHDVVPANPHTPQKSIGFLSKAMEYVFGW